MPSEVPGLLMEARRVLGIGSQGKLGELLGSSARTGERWERGHSSPSVSVLHQLAALVHPKDPELAGQLAAAGWSTLLQLGIEAPPPPPPAPAPPPPPPAPPPPPPPDPAFIVDTVVCAAAEEMDMMPDAIRPALRAAFRRARLAGLSVADVDTALHAGKAPPASPRS
ncbi:MAG: helix-turn-helix domain-containing protein [Polyangiaceae bacterium]